MRNLNRILFLSGIILFTAFSCEEEKNDPADYVPIEIKKITDFGCSNCSIRIKPAWDNDTNYIFYTEDEFTQHLQYLETENLPSIDFENYFLIIGTKYFPTWTEIVEEKAKENDLEIVYQVYYKIYDYTLPGVLNYHVFISKPVTEKTIRVELIKK